MALRAFNNVQEREFLAVDDETGALHVINIDKTGVQTDRGVISISTLINNFPVDAASGALLVIDTVHEKIHNNIHYDLSYSAVIGGGLPAEVRFATPDTTRWSHLVWSFTSDDAYTITVSEVTTKTHEAGNVLLPLNSNRNSNNTSGMTWCHTPGGAGAGNTIFSFSGGANKTVTTAIGRFERILKQNTAYLASIVGANTDVVHMTFDWYERVNN